MVATDAPAPARQGTSARAPREATSGRPFVHRFRASDGQAYVYDGNTGHILRVNDIVFDALGLIGTRDDGAVAAALGQRYPQTQVNQALRSIRRSQKQHGVFSSERPRAIRFWHRKATLRRLLERELGQLILEVTQDCNLRCSYCAFTDFFGPRRKHSPQVMSMEIAHKAIDYLMSHSADRQRVTISFYGGEPLLNFDLIRDCIEYAERTVSGAKLLMLLMTSNGTALSSERAAFLAAHSVRIMVSIDGPAAMHDRYRPFTGGRGSFNAIAKNLLRLREMAPEYYESCITFNVVLAPPYDMEKVLEFINSGEIIGPKQGVRMTYASGRDTTFYSRFTEDELAADGGRAGMWQRYESAAVCGQFNGEPAPEHRALHALFNQGLAGVYLRTLSRRMPRYYHPGGICVPGVRRLFTTVDGRFFVCEKGNTTTETLQIGDVDSGVDVDRVWEMIRTYGALTAVDCRNCWANRLCNNCFVLAERGGRFDKQDKQMSCAIIRSQVHTNMVRMCDILSKNPQGLKFMDDMTFT